MLQQIVKVDIYAIPSNRIRIIISEHDDGMFYGHVVNFGKSTPHNDVSFDINTEFSEWFVDQAEKNVYQSCVAWAKNHLQNKDKFSLSESYP